MPIGGFSPISRDYFRIRKPLGRLAGRRDTASTAGTGPATARASWRPLLWFRVSDKYGYRKSQGMNRYKWNGYARYGMRMKMQNAARATACRWFAVSNKKSPLNAGFFVADHCVMHGEI